MFWRRLLVVLVAILLPIFQANAVTRYVDSATGNDLNDGLSVGQALATLNTAVNALSPGDTLIVEPGVGYCSAPLATFIGTISTTTLTISTLQSGTVQTGALVGSGVTAGTTITSGSGTSWTITPSQTVSSATSMYIDTGLGTSNCAVIPKTASGTFSGGVCTNVTTIKGDPAHAMPVIRGERNASFGIYGGGLHCITISGLEVAGWAGSLTLAGAWTNASSSTATSNALYNATGIYFDDGVAPSNQTVGTSEGGGQTTIPTSTNPSTGGVLVGDLAYDSTNTSALVAGTNVTAVTTSSVTVTPAIGSTSVTSGDTLKFWHVPHHITISGNIVHDWPCGGLGTERADYVTISGNWVYNNGNWSPLACSGISPYIDYPIDTLTTTKNYLTGNIGYANIDIIGNHNAGVTGTTSATTAVGNNTLHFSVTPNVNTTNATQVYDTTSGNSGAILAGTTVTGVTGIGGVGTITLSQNVQTGSGSGVGSGDTFLFSPITDGEGIFIDDNNDDQGTMNLPYPGRTLVQNNLAVNNGNCGVCQYKSNHVDFSYNTTYNNMASSPVPEQGEMSDSSGTDTTFYYNLMINTGTHAILPDLSTSTTTYAYNAGNGTGTMSGTNNVTAALIPVNPTTTAPTAILPFTSTNFELQPGSPAIDAVPSSPLFTRSTDILGNPGLAGANYDMGAFESPCTTYSTGTNTAATVRTPAYITGTEFPQNAPSGSITPTQFRDLFVTAACGRSPWAH